MRPDSPFHLPGDPSLPPGCTAADIDRAFADPDEDEDGEPVELDEDARFFQTREGRRALARAEAAGYD